MTVPARGTRGLMGIDTATERALKFRAHFPDYHVYVAEIG